MDIDKQIIAFALLAIASSGVAVAGSGLTIATEILVDRK